MSRKRSQKAAEREARMKAALEGLASGKYSTKHQAAKALELSEALLARRVQGKKSRVEAREEQQALRRAEEKGLEKWIGRLTAMGHPATHEFIREIAEEIRKRRDPDNLLPLGSSWVQQFLNRHPHLKTQLSQ